MKLEEAKKIIGEKYFNEDNTFTRNSNGWSSYDGGDTICLDANYSIEELEAFITIIKTNKVDE